MTGGAGCLRTSKQRAIEHLKSTRFHSERNSIEIAEISHAKACFRMHNSRSSASFSRPSKTLLEIVSMTEFGRILAFQIEHGSHALLGLSLPW